MSKRKPKRSQSQHDDELAIWNEWTQHLWVPGYWLGRARSTPFFYAKGACTLIFFSGLMLIATLLGALLGTNHDANLPLNLLGSGLLLVWGIALWRKTTKRRKRSTATQRHHKR